MLLAVILDRLTQAMGEKDKHNKAKWFERGPIGFIYKLKNGEKMINKKILVGGLASVLLASNLFGAKITSLKSTIAEETFQMLIVNEILKKWVNEIVSTNEVNYDIAFQTVANKCKK